MADEPMTDEQLAEIREFTEALAYLATSARHILPAPANRSLVLRELLAEVDRLRAREAAAMEILRAVSQSPDGKSCAFCGYPLASNGFERWHTTDCTVLKARALLAQE